MEVSSTIEGPTQDFCPICLESESTYKKLPCDHSFCATCIAHAEEFSNHCPMCRAEIKKEDELITETLGKASVLLIKAERHLNKLKQFRNISKPEHHEYTKSIATSVKHLEHVCKSLRINTNSIGSHITYPQPTYPAHSINYNFLNPYEERFVGIDGMNFQGNGSFASDTMSAMNSIANDGIQNVSAILDSLRMI